MKFRHLAAILCVGITLTGRPVLAQDDVHDPLEPFNRGVFFFNEAVSAMIFTPVATGYRAVTTPVMRDLLKNAADNTIEPVSMFNAFLQGDFDHGMVSFWRFIINTTVGLGGLNDVAVTAGLERRQEDFGQTLGVWGFGEGPYLVLPLLGPSNFRDVWRWPAGYYLDPVTVFVDDSATVWAYIGAVALIEYESLMDPMNDLRAASIDPYVTFRSVYTQQRRASILNQYDQEGEVP
jgi:phospholipid-binding lipoprotein MlaA